MTTVALQLSDVKLCEDELVRLDRALEGGEPISGLRPSAMTWKHDPMVDVTEEVGFFGGDVLACGMCGDGASVFVIVRHGDGIAAISAHWNADGLCVRMQTQQHASPKRHEVMLGLGHQRPDDAIVGTQYLAYDYGQVYVREADGWQLVSADGQGLSFGES